ncbi:DoxX family membrane protein [Sphingomonas sp. UYAg733]
MPRYLFGVCPLIFGLSHFTYADFTAAMVPGWLPGPLVRAYATGIGHVAAGVGILSGIRSRLAATVLAAMCGMRSGGRGRKCHRSGPDAAIIPKRVARHERTP